MNWNSLSGVAGVTVGWILAQLTRHFEEVWFGAKLKIECDRISGNRDENPDELYIKFLVQNTTQRHVAKSCHAYLAEIHKISNGRVASDNLLSDTYRLPWAGGTFEPRDIPAKVKQYVDLVHFSKHHSGWRFATTPSLSPSLASLSGHRGTYRFTVVVAGDGAAPQSKQIYVDYDGDWTRAAPYE